MFQCIGVVLSLFELFWSTSVRDTFWTLMHDVYVLSNSRARCIIPGWIEADITQGLLDGSQLVVIFKWERLQHCKKMTHLINVPNIVSSPMAGSDCIGTIARWQECFIAVQLTERFKGSLIRASLLSILDMAGEECSWNLLGETTIQVVLSEFERKSVFTWAIVDVDVYFYIRSCKRV